MTKPFQIAVLFEGTGLDGDSSSNVGRLSRALVRDERQHVILKGGSGTYPFARIGAWDTVDATVGIDGVDFIDVPRAVHVARHAVAINEYRGHFDYVPMRGKQVIERFFAGSHTDVGGGYKDHALTDVAGAWVVRGALRQGLRLKEGVKLAEAFSADPVVHNSLGDATNFWGALEGVRRKIDPKRLHRSVKKILSRVLDCDGNPVPPEAFRDAPTI